MSILPPYLIDARKELIVPKNIRIQKYFFVNIVMKPDYSDLAPSSILYLFENSQKLGVGYLSSIGYFWRRFC
jgi:hypothetical protein